jgi:hypothetical protein
MVRDLSRCVGAARPAPPTLDALTVGASNVGLQYRLHLVGMFGEVLFVVTGQHRDSSTRFTKKPAVASTEEVPA